MKFGKSLSNQIEETLPEWRDKFLSYKELKKRLKLVDRTAGDRPIKRLRIDGGDKDAAMTKEEMDFIQLLENELEKFNAFFMEQEEEYIIRLKELQERVTKASIYSYEMIKIRKEIVDFHGEMVLLENYSALNYTGLVKILKKYDKRTGALIRLPFIQKVLQQPFFTTDLLYKLVKECEIMLDQLFSISDLPANEDEGNDPTTSSSSCKNVCPLTLPKELAEIEYMESLYMKSTITALRVLKDIRKGSSTVSVFSLPPLQIGGLDESWINVPILEQVAK